MLFSHFPANLYKLLEITPHIQTCFFLLDINYFLLFLSSDSLLLAQSTINIPLNKNKMILRVIY